MKITVIGTINKDLILPFRNAPIESFGGIFYDISILSYLLEEDDEIIPVSFIGEDIFPTVQAILKKLPNISTKGLIPLPQKNHKVILEYASPSRRQEKSLFQFPALKWEQMAPFIDSDMVNGASPHSRMDSFEKRTNEASRSGRCRSLLNS